MAKATCPVTRAEFLENATPITVVINGVVILLSVFDRIRVVRSQRIEEIVARNKGD